MDFATQKQIKTQALLKIAFEQSTKAREGFDANNNTLLQNQKEFEENIKEIKTTIGTEFLPVLNKLLQAITPIIDKIGKRVKENPKLTRNILLAV